MTRSARLQSFPRRSEFDRLVSLGHTRSEFGMTNLGLSYDAGLEADLRSHRRYAIHAAWNFMGVVWFEDGKLHEEVWQFDLPIDHLESESIASLMDLANGKYGGD